MASEPRVSAAGVVSFAQERRIRTVCAPQPAVPVRGPLAKTVPAVCRLPGPVDTGALEHAVNALVRRHPGLHYRFVNLDGRVSLRRVDGEEPGVPPVVPVSPDTAHHTDDARMRVMRTEIDRPFDVLGWPLLRAGVLQCDRPLFYLSADHLVTDGWSALLAAREVEELYTAALEDRQANLPPTADFLRYSEAQRRRYASGPALDRMVEGLHTLLGGRPVHPAFPVDAAWDLSRGRYLTLSLLDADETAELAKLCRSWRVTLFMAVLAAVGVAARELCLRTEVGVLVATHNRDDPDIRHGIGWYANMLPLYFPVGEAQRFGDAVREVRARLMELLPYYELPLAKVLDATPSGYYDGLGTHTPTFFMSFVDLRGVEQAGRWHQLDVAPAYRVGHGTWIVLRDSGLSAVVASPHLHSGEERVREFESRIAAVLRGVVAHLAAAG